MVGLHGDHNGVRPCSGRLAYRTWLVALGILPERSTGRRCLGDFALARPGKPRRKRSPDRLDWHISGHLRTWWCGHGISGICQARLVEFFGGRKLDRWRGLLDSFRSGRTSHCFATGAPGALQVALFSRRKLAHAGVVRCDRYLFLLFPTNLIRLHGYSATAAGAAALPMILLMFFLSPWSGSLVSRVGGKVPLTGGPLIVAAAFTLFAFLPAGSSYWTTIFPSFLILGFGMTVTVAPLTTVMMASVEQDHAGAAS